MCDSYVHGITQKYRLAVALAVLKKKPEDVSIEKYIEDLNNKLNNEKIEDLELTVCSDDFDMGENPSTIDVNTINIEDRQQNNNSNNSETILKDYKIQKSINDVEIRDDNTHSRKEISNNITEIQTDNSNEESQTKGPTSINLTQMATASNLESTFCETQYEHNFSNLNEVSNINSDNNKSNEVSVPNEVHHFQNEVNVFNTADHTYYDSQATVLYSLHGLTQNYTHVSQSQNYDEIVISDKFIKARNNIHTDNTSDYNIIEISNTPNSFQSNLNAIQFSKNDTVNSNQTIIELNENNILTNKRNETIINEPKNKLSVKINDSFTQYAQDINEIDISENITYKVAENNETNDMNEIDENSNMESQIVSFKVVEELNKIKNYINKKVQRRISNDGSIDSGYKSDSQSKCSFKSSLQLSGNWLNQSAHSLYEYITHCPLLTTSHEIIGEISQVLGQLIDRLHEEEKYPSFLDELLENVNNLLQDLFQESGGEDVLLRKDEAIQRLLLLNKSVHIQKYTIEKITFLLENILSHLTNSEETYETSNINEMENISYIFHLLEVILQRYIKGKDILSQETSNSQIEMRKSSITELWRRKWNPNYREDNITEELTPRKCVLINCNEVLNKLVISCMDGYSLVAFAALSCFNMLQS